jgi:hypothetical protein
MSEVSIFQAKQRLRSAIAFCQTKLESTSFSEDSKRVVRGIMERHESALACLEKTERILHGMEIMDRMYK